MPGAARLVLADGVVHLDPEPAVLEAMLEGWALQQRTRFLRESTINPGSRWSVDWPDLPMSTRGSGTPPRWRHSSTLLTRRSGRPLAVSTARNYQNDLRLFFDYITDARYGWPSTCNERFGQAPVQLLHEWNTITHASEY